MKKLGVKCQTCPDYQDRQRIAEVLGGIWDYNTCHRTCWRDSHLKFQINNLNWQRNAYVKVGAR